MLIASTTVVELHTLSQPLKTALPFGVPAQSAHELLSPSQTPHSSSEGQLEVSFASVIQCQFSQHEIGQYHQIQHQLLAYWDFQNLLKQPH